ncbi:MAG: hypothetical protein PHS14_17715 [Elusimicrobia bacterium]|nr:hypothetical protein [Elusimicrobiota bacterium]
MTPPIVHPLDVSFVLAVTAGAGLGSALVGPAGSMLGLVVAAGYFALNQWLARKGTE